MTKSAPYVSICIPSYNDRRYLAHALSARIERAWTGRRDSLDEQFRRRWRRLVSPGHGKFVYTRFPTFPNPHIRSNGFMIDRRRLLELGSDLIRTKIDACGFESGIDSLTARVRRQGMAALVVGRGGQDYDVPDWTHSGTFRLGQQKNLLLTAYKVRCEVPAYFLNEGTYFVGFGLTTFSGGVTVHFFERGAVSFNVRDPIVGTSSRGGWAGSMPGAVRPNLNWMTERIT
jgi:hypothetical protein